MKSTSTRKDPGATIPEERIKAVLAKYEAAPEWSRRRAEAREEILKSLDSYAAARRLPVTRVDADYYALFKCRAIPNLPGWVYDQVKALSRPTVFRWRQFYKDYGVPGLISDHGSDKRGERTAIAPEIQIFIAGQLAANPSLRPVRIAERIEQFFKDTAPHEKTVYRYVREYLANPREREFWTFKTDPRKWKNKFQAAFGDMSADTPHFGHTWEMDSTPADVITSDKIRCTLMGLIDVYSRCARLIVSPTSKSLGVAALMRRGLLDWGKPARIRKDNGKDYSSKHVEAITAALRIDTPPLPKFTPEAKPFIERFLGTCTRGLLEILPGYCGHSVADRQALRERETWAAKIFEPGSEVMLPFTMRELQEAADKWIRVYERTPHKGLKGRTPLDVSTESRRQPPKIRDPRVLDILLAPVAERMVGKKGIALDGGHYVSPDLVEFVGWRVELRRDVTDAGLIYVFDAVEKAYLCTASDQALSGKSLEDYLAAKKRHLKALKEKVRALETISRNTPDPYTVLVDSGEIMDTPPPGPAAFHAAADTPGIREAEKALKAPAPARGLADELGGDNPAQVLELAAKRKRVDRHAAAASQDVAGNHDTRDKAPVTPAERTDRDPGRWEHYPLELLDNPIELYRWYEAKARAVGLTPEDREHMDYIRREFSTVRYWLDEVRTGETSAAGTA